MAQSTFSPPTNLELLESAALIAIADFFIKGIDNTFKHWTKRRKFTLYKA